jgi:uncharacterized protein YjbI with pentapeptide repeats
VLSGTKINGCEISSYTECPDADLRDANLKTGSISFGNFSNADFRGAELSATSMVKANLTNADLRKPRVILMDISAVNLSQARLGGATNGTAVWMQASCARWNSLGPQSGVRLYRKPTCGVRTSAAPRVCNTVMSDGSVMGVTAGDCPGTVSFGATNSTVKMNPDNPLSLGAKSQMTSTPVKPVGSVLNGCTLQPEINCSGADLSGSNLTNVLPYQSTLIAFKIDSANAEGLSMSFSDARRLQTRGTMLIGAGATRSNLKGAQLSGAELSFAAIALADLTGADLSGANLGFGDVSGFDMTRANLAGVNIS